MSHKPGRNLSDDDLLPHEEQLARSIGGARPERLPADKVARIERRLLARFKQQRQPAHSTTRSMALQWAFAFVLVAVLIAATSGVVAASTTSLPGETLYPVKRLSENVQLFLASEQDRPALHVSFAENRLAEIEALSERGVVLPDAVQEMATETESALSSIESTPADRQAELLERFVALSERQQAVLAQLESSSPENAQDALANAQEVSQRGLARAQEAILKLGGATPVATATGSEEAESAEPARTPNPQGPQHTPPGQAQTPSGQQNTPPGLQKTPEALQTTSPGNQKTPPGQQKTPPGQQKTPPGQQKTPPGEGNGDHSGGGSGGGRP